MAGQIPDIWMLLGGAATAPEGTDSPEKLGLHLRRQGASAWMPESGASLIQERLRALGSQEQEKTKLKKGGKGIAADILSILSDAAGAYARAYGAPIQANAMQRLQELRQQQLEAANLPIRERNKERLDLERMMLLSELEDIQRGKNLKDQLAQEARDEARANRQRRLNFADSLKLQQLDQAGRVEIQGMIEARMRAQGDDKVTPEDKQLRDQLRQIRARGVVDGKLQPNAIERIAALENPAERMKQATALIEEIQFEIEGGNYGAGFENNEAAATKILEELADIVFDAEREIEDTKAKQQAEFDARQNALNTPIARRDNAAQEWLRSLGLPTILGTRNTLP